MKILKISILIVASLMFSSCLMHVIYGSEVRLQLVNRSEMAFKEFEIYDPSGQIEPIIVFEDEILPGNKSIVETVEMTGKFNVRILKSDTNCTADCWTNWDIGKVKFKGGSSRLYITGQTTETLNYELR